MQQQPNHAKAGDGVHRGRAVARMAALVLAVAFLVAGAAQAAVNTSVNGNTVTSTISLSGEDADLTLSFSQVENLSAEVIGVGADLLGLLDILQLLDRLLGLDLSAVLGAFPVMIGIDPADQLRFTDTVRVEVHTHELVYSPGTRIRLFKSEDGGPFFDITEAIEAGSVRARGRTGGFSEFLLLNDTRSTSSVVREKYDRISGRLDDAAAWLDASTMDSLQQMLAGSRTLFDQGDYTGALASLDVFAAEVRVLSGAVLPNRWSADGSLDNVGGDLQAHAATLRFSLGFLRDYGN